MKPIKTFTIFMLTLVVMLCVSCEKDNEPDLEVIPSIEALVTGYNDFNNAELNITWDNIRNAGFLHGDIVAVIVDGKEYEMPFYSGFFNVLGQPQLVDYPTIDNIVIGGLERSVELQALTGKTIQIKMIKEKGAIQVERTLAMEYTSNRSDYASDVVFANARVIETTGMAKGKFYRTASPFDNQYSRAPYVAAFLKEHGVQTALNLTDDEAKINSYTDIPEYSQQMIDKGNVVLCKIDANYRSDKYNATFIAGLIEMMKHPAPYVIHCTEGKDRTGYACAFLEALAGASYEEIAADYLVTYDNYFGITPEKNPENCQVLLDVRLDDALMYYCDVNSVAQLKTINLSKAVSNYLLQHGMSGEQVEELKRILCED